MPRRCVANGYALLSPGQTIVWVAKGRSTKTEMGIICQTDESVFVGAIVYECSLLIIIITILLLSLGSLLITHTALTFITLRYIYRIIQVHNTMIHFKKQPWNYIVPINELCGIVLNRRKKKTWPIIFNTIIIFIIYISLVHSSFMDL